MDILATVICFLLSVLVSTALVRRGIPALEARQTRGASGRSAAGDGGKALPEGLGTDVLFDWASNGLWIGLCETVLIFVFIFEKQYGALAIIVAAKEFVRREKIRKDPTYYLLGTLINITVAILFALLARHVTGLG